MQERPINNKEVSSLSASAAELQNYLGAASDMADFS